MVFTRSCRSGSPRTGQNGCAGQVAEHTGKYQLVQRINAIPINQSPKTGGIEKRRLANQAAMLVRGNFKFQPGTTRQLHLGEQAQSLRWLIEFDSPEIKGVPDMQSFRISAAATHANSADQ